VPLLCAAFPDAEFYVSQSAPTKLLCGMAINVINSGVRKQNDFMIAGNVLGSRTTRATQRISFFPDQDGSVARQRCHPWQTCYYHEGGSDKHLRDIAGILKFSSDQVDRDYVSRFAGANLAWRIFGKACFRKIPQPDTREVTQANANGL